MQDARQSLQQKAYPSASVFGYDAPAGEPVSGDFPAVFGSSATLPQQTAALSLGLPTQGNEGGLTSNVAALPIVRPEQVRSDVFGPRVVADEAPPLTAQIPAVEPGQRDLKDGMLRASYPSALPETTNIPKKESKKKPSLFIPNVRGSLKSFVSNDQSRTVPIRGIDRIAQRQFTLAANVNRDRFVKEQEEARDVLNFAVRLAETMFHYGADTMDVDSAVMAVCSTYGLDDVEVDVTNQSIIINYVSDLQVGEKDKGLYSTFGAGTKERFSHTVVRVVRSNSENYSSLDATYKLIHSITEEGMGRKKAEQELKAISRRKKPYSPAMILVFNLIMAVSFTFGVGGSWRAALVAFFTFIAVHFSMQWVGRLKLPYFFSMVVGAGVITSAAILVGQDTSFARSLGFYVSGPHVVAAGLMMLLPTFRLVSAAQDALTGYPLTAAGKFVTTAVGFIGLVVGIAMALALMNYFDAVNMDMQQAVFNPPPVWVTVSGMAMGSVMVAAATQGTVKNMVWVLLISLAGQLAYYGLSLLAHEDPGKLNVAVGAFVVGALSAFLAFKLHSPQAIYAVPGIMFLLPGLSIFRGLYSLVIDPEPTVGLTNLLNASATILALSAGVVLGVYLMQYSIQRVLDKQVKKNPETESKNPRTINLDIINR